MELRLIIAYALIGLMIFVMGAAFFKPRSNRRTRRDMMRGRRRLTDQIGPSSLITRADPDRTPEGL